MFGGAQQHSLPCSPQIYALGVAPMWAEWALLLGLSQLLCCEVKKSCKINKFIYIKKKKSCSLTWLVPALWGHVPADLDLGLGELATGTMGKCSGHCTLVTFCCLQLLSLPSGSFHKSLILISQRVDRMKTTITEN